MKEKVIQSIDYIKQKLSIVEQESEFDFDSLIVEVPSIFTFSSIVTAMDIIKQYKVSAIPVVNFNNEVVGSVNEREIANLISIRSVASWSELKNTSIDNVMVEKAQTKTRDAKLDEITAEFNDKEVEIVAIVDEEGKYTGSVVTATKLIEYTSDSIKPRTIGGMATPLGVYLTDGYYSAGAGNPGLIVTGISFSIVINILTYLSVLLLNHYDVSQSLLLLFQLAILLLFLRLSPLVGYHAAEHQTITAMERGIDLTLENVRSQPKEHERCGTNFMILFLGLSLLFLVSLDYLKNIDIIWHTLILIVFTYLIISKWRKLGMFLQKIFTTGKATDKQLLNGIKAGQQLLEYYKNNTRPVKVTPLGKIWKMGIPQILISFLIVSLIIQYLASLFGWPIELVCATIML